MRLRVAALALAILAVAGGLVGCDFSCPAALLEGALVRAGSTLVVQAENGATTAVQWPFGYSIKLKGDRLVVTDLFGAPKAREGDHVRLGGGMVGKPESAFGVCGDFEAVPS